MPRRALVVAGLALALAGCATLKGMLRELKRPTLQFEQASATELSISGVTVTLQYQVTNPNDVELNVASLSYELDVEGVRVTSGELPGEIHLPANGRAQLVVPVRIQFADISGLIEKLMRKSEFTYKLSGIVGISTPIGPIPLSYSHEDRVAIPRL